MALEPDDSARVPKCFCDLAARQEPHGFVEHEKPKHQGQLLEELAAGPRTPPRANPAAGASGADLGPVEDRFAQNIRVAQNVYFPALPTRSRWETRHIARGRATTQASSRPSSTSTMMPGGASSASSVRRAATSTWMRGG